MSSLCLLPAWLPLLLLVSECNGMDFAERATNYLFGTPPELLGSNGSHAVAPQNGLPPPGCGLHSSGGLPQASPGYQGFRIPCNFAGGSAVPTCQGGGGEACGRAPPSSWFPSPVHGRPLVHQNFPGPHNFDGSPNFQAYPDPGLEAGGRAPPPSRVPFPAHGSPSLAYQSFHSCSDLHDGTNFPAYQGNGDEASDHSLSWLATSGLPMSWFPTSWFPSLAHERSPENDGVVEQLHNSAGVDWTSPTVSPHPTPQSALTRSFEHWTLSNNDDEAMAKAISESMKVIPGDNEDMIHALSESMITHLDQQRVQNAIEESRRLKFDEDMAKARQASMAGGPDDKELLHAISESKIAHSNDECLRMAMERSKKFIFDQELKEEREEKMKGEKVEKKYNGLMEDKMNFITEEKQMRVAIENSMKELAVSVEGGKLFKNTGRHQFF